MKTFLITAIHLLLFCLTPAQEKKVEPFMPDLFSKFPNVRDIAISGDGDEIYFTVQSYSDEISFIANIKKGGNAWSNPEIASFSGKYFDLEPFMTHDGLKLYFASNRPITDSEKEPKDFDIWYVERKSKNSEWADPVNIGSPVNSSYNDFYPSLSQNNNLYLTSDNPMGKGKDDIFFCLWENGKYEPPIPLGDSINSDGYEFNAFIAPDESYIVFTGYQRKDGIGSGDLYISYKDSLGIWEKARNLGQQVNSTKMDYCPFVDLKENLLYFTSKRTSVNDPGRIFNSMKDFFDELSKLDNGLSRIYKTKFK